MLFSVIMRTYNRSAHLPAAIESVLSQTVKDFELIVCDDGSTDSTADLMDYYVKKDPRIVYLQKEHSGIAATGNYAIERANGLYIVQADSDDIQLPDKLEIAYEGLADGADFTYSGYYYCNPKGEIWEYVPPRPFTLENIKANEVASGESISYPRTIWEKTPYRDELTINDDGGLLVDFYKAGYSYTMVDRPSFKYRMMRDSVSYARKKEVDASTLEIYKELDGTIEGVKIK